MDDTLRVISPAFENGGMIPKWHTGFGEDDSPALELTNLSGAAVSLAVIMDDLDVPFGMTLNHWVVWNLPAVGSIPEGIPKGAVVEELGNAVQGVGWGRNRYRGPKQPPFIRKAHRYRFAVYALDRFLKLPPSGRKRDLLFAMEGHIVQRGEIVGIYQP